MPGNSVNMQTKMQSAALLSASGILVLLALLGYDLALRKPPNTNQKWKAGYNRAVE